MNEGETLDLYRKALNYNVIGRYDPQIKQLLYHTPHAVLYRYNVAAELWEKQDTQGVLAIYLRNVNGDAPEQLLKVEDSTLLTNTTADGANSHIDSTASMSTLIDEAIQAKDKSSGAKDDSQDTIKILQGEDIYNYGLILLNRSNPENFSLGIVPNSVVNKRRIFRKNPASVAGVNGQNMELNNMQIEKNDGLLIIKSLLGQVFGLWIYNEKDRETLFTLIKYLLESEPRDSFI
ncbi:hypothetical protein ACO0QE_000007 [Hanseniaspora vineae]